MELRDQFAMALIDPLTNMKHKMSHVDAAKSCYAFADAMMEARKEKVALSPIVGSPSRLKCSCGKVIMSSDEHYRFILHIMNGGKVFRNDALNGKSELIDYDLLKFHSGCACSISGLKAHTLIIAEPSTL